MHITKVELKNFKRFTDLTIDSIPADAKLVLLIGSNGSGKSSVFDAFEFDNSVKRIPPISVNDTALQRANNAREADVISQKLLTYRKSSLIQDTPRIEITTTLRPRYVGGTFVDEAPPTTYHRDIEDTSQTIRYYGRSSYRQILRLERTLSVRGVDIRNDSDRPASFTDRDDRFANDIDRISKQIFEDISK